MLQITTMKKKLNRMKELRNFNLEVRATSTRQVEGYALVFNKESNDLGGFTEVIEPTALENVLEKSDILCLLNHNEDRGVLARSQYGKGSLSLEIDNTGLKYRFEAPNTALGDELLEGLKRGDISTSSFAFTIEKDTWSKKDGKYLRTINKFKQLFDVSPVYRPAYNDTSVKIDTRGLENFKELEKQELDSYYNELKKRLENA